MNVVCLTGRLTADPELKKTQSGKSVVSFTIAVDRDFKSADGERQADFINCVAWNQPAEFITKFFKKGKMIAIVGELRNRQYETKDGTKRTVTEVIVFKAEFCGNSVNGNKTSPNASTEDFTTVEDDDLPF